MSPESDVTSEPTDSPVLHVKVYPSGYHEHAMDPAFLPHAAHSLRNLMRDAAYHATGELRDALNKARDLLAPYDHVPSHPKES